MATTYPSGPCTLLLLCCCLFFSSFSLHNEKTQKSKEYKQQRHRINIIIRLLLLFLLLLLIYHYYYYYYYHHHVIIIPSIIRDHPVISIINSDYLKKRKLANDEIIELEDYHHFDNICRYLEDLAERYPTCVSRCGEKKKVIMQLLPSL